MSEEPMGWFHGNIKGSARSLTPAEKAVLRRSMVKPLLGMIRRQMGLQLALTQTSFWQELRPILQAATEVEELEARDPAIASRVVRMIRANVGKPTPISIEGAEAVARQELQLAV